MKPDQLQKMLEKYKAPFEVDADTLGYYVLDSNKQIVIETLGNSLDHLERAQFACMALNVFHYSTTYALGIRGN